MHLCEEIYREQRDKIVVFLWAIRSSMCKGVSSACNTSYAWKKNQWGKGRTGLQPSAGRVLNFQLLAHLAQGIADNVQLMAQLVHYAGNALRVFQDLHTLSVGIVLHPKGALDGFCKLSIEVKKKKKKMSVL